MWSWDQDGLCLSAPSRGWVFWPEGLDLCRGDDGSPVGLTWHCSQRLNTPEGLMSPHLGLWWPHKAVPPLFMALTENLIMLPLFDSFSAAHGPQFWNKKGFYVPLGCCSERAWGNLKACGGLESFAWSFSQLGETRMTTHLGLLYLHQLSGWGSCPSPVFILSVPVQLCGAGDMDSGTPPIPTQLVFPPSPSWANIPIGKCIWTLTWGTQPSWPPPHPPITQLCETSRDLLWWLARPLQSWHSFGMVWAIISGCCDLSVLNSFWKLW